MLDATGKVVGEGKFPTDGPHEFRCPLAGAAGSRFKVVVMDDQRGVWSLSGANLGIVMKTVPGFSIGGVGRGRFHLFVPAGPKEFRVRLAGLHTGPYGGALVSPAGKTVASHQGANVGGALVRGAPPAAAVAGHPERGELVVRPAPADTGKTWGLVLWAAGDIGCELDGVPPYLSRTGEEWFEVK